MAIFDVNVRTNIITFLAPQERIDPIIAFDHQMIEEYYQGILRVDDLTRPETYMLPDEDPKTLLMLAIRYLSIDDLEIVVEEHLDILDQGIVDMILDRDVSNNLVNMMPAHLVLSNKVGWWKCNSDYRFNFILNLDLSGRLTDECLHAIAANGTRSFISTINNLLITSPILIAALSK